MAHVYILKFVWRLALCALIASFCWHPVSAGSLGALCKPDAAKYDALQSFKSRTTPQRVAEVYLQAFLIPVADSDTQAVWRRVVNDQIPSEQALNDYVKQYHGSTSNSEKEILIARINNQIRDMQTIYELILGFEEIALNSDTVMAVVTEGWGRNDQQLAKPLKHYLGLVDEKTRFYRSSAGGNLKEDEASVRAVVETQAAIDRDRGVPRSVIHDKNDPCYKERLTFTELWLREKAVTRQAGGLNEEEYNFVKSKTRDDPMLVSRLEYYTHFKFGPRDYSFDRLKAWQMAANSPVTSPPVQTNMCEVVGSVPHDEHAESCFKINKGNTDMQYLRDCAILVDKVSRTIDRINSLNSQGQLASQSTESRVDLLSDLLATKIIPMVIYKDVESLESKRLEAASKIYSSGAEMNVDASYWEYEKKNSYKQIIDKVYAKACERGWTHLFTEPDSYTSMELKQKQDIIRDIVSVFLDDKQVTLEGEGVYFPPSLPRNLFPTSLIEARYVHPWSNEKEYRDTIIFEDISYNLSFDKINPFTQKPVSFRDALLVTFEELMHAHQYELWAEQYQSGKLRKDSNACVQARLFMYNQVLFHKAKSFIWRKAEDDPAYLGEPLENHAKRFAQYTTDKLLEGPASTCQ